MIQADFPSKHLSSISDASSNDYPQRLEIHILQRDGFS